MDVVEIKWRRNLGLTQSDWTQLPDCKLTQEQKDAWSVYRQELRDLTKQDGFPLVVNWPKIPVFNKEEQ
jgi:hypothetical protein